MIHRWQVASPDICLSNYILYVLGNASRVRIIKPMLHSAQLQGVYKVTQEMIVIIGSRFWVVTVKRHCPFLLNGGIEECLFFAEILNLKRAPDTHSKKGGPGFSQAVLEAGRRERAVVLCWLDSVSYEYHLGLEAFWCGGSILFPMLTHLGLRHSSLLKTHCLRCVSSGRQQEHPPGVNDSLFHLPVCMITTPGPQDTSGM